MTRFSEERLIEFGEAWARGDVEALMTFIAPDCTYSASAGPEPGETFVGRDAVRAGFIKMLKHDASGTSKAGRVFVSGNVGIAEWSYEFTGDDGRKTEVRGCDLFEFSGDLIRRKDAFRKTFAATGGQDARTVE
ncbi:MAG TPA: nuclear transport factor 2 family protein [Thermoanaerobaculia bacterium]|nr:nuclear transport factor 2 family protein [Thermoanaerobaculia bacterium]